MKPTKANIARYRSNLQSEIDSAALYRAMQAVEKNPQIAEVYGRLAAVEEGHAEFWRRRLQASGARAGAVKPSLRARALIWAARRFGPESVLPAVVTMESMDREAYDQQVEAKGVAMQAQERSHARVLAEIAGLRGIQWDGDLFSRLEGRHGAGGGNALRAAILGANDGLVSNLSLVMGVAGAAFSEQTVLITGLAGLLAGSCSMAMGEWLSVQGSRELYARQIATETEEVDEFPDEEREELVLIYRAKGLSMQEAGAIADRLMQNREAAVDTMVREELGINPKDLGGSAWAAAASSFGVFMVGAIIPVLPFLLLKGNDAVIASAVASAVALFLIGAVTSMFTARGAWFSGVRQLFIGAAAAGITYGAGHLFGVAVTG